MFDSDDSEDGDRFVPAVLNRPKVANHIVHESFTVDTRDHEDHTFCGVMFDVACRDSADGGAPINFLQVNSISVRGDLGPLTVWSTPDTHHKKESQESCWELLYEKEHQPSRENYEKLELSRPIKLAPGETCGLYVHSRLPGDDAIVYDNKRSHMTYEDRAFRVLPGKAHLSNRPFGRYGMWGFPWRDSREFVGRIGYGVAYLLWNPEVHRRFPREFQQAVLCCLLCAQRAESPLHCLQDEVIFYIFNMCRYDWFGIAPAVAPPAEPRSRGTSGFSVPHTAFYDWPPMRRTAWAETDSEPSMGDHSDESLTSSDTAGAGFDDDETMDCFD